MGGVLSRLLAASLGGYGVTCAATACLAVLLPWRPAESVLVASMLSFAVYVAAIIWAFAASTPMRAWLWLVGATAVCLAIALPGLPR